MKKCSIYARAEYITTVSDATLIKRAFEIQQSFGCSRSADSIYIALAEHLQRTPPLRVIHFLQQWCYDLACYKLVGIIRYHPEQTDFIKKITNNLSPQALFRFLKELQIAKREALHPLNAKLLFESVFLSYQQMIRTLHKE